MIEAPLELGEVAHDVFFADSAVGADERALDVAEQRVDPLEGWMTRGPAA